MILRFSNAHQRCKKCKTKLVKYKRVKGLCTRCYSREYQRKNKRHIKSLPWMHKIRFAGWREGVILRDDQRCTNCGITRGEHFTQFGNDLCVHHLDGKGRYSKVKNHDPDNLVTLCLECLGRLARERSGGWSSPEAKAKSLANLKYIKRRGGE